MFSEELLVSKMWPCYLLSNEVCSYYISPVGLFMQFFVRPIFRPTNLAFRPQKRAKQVGKLVFKYARVTATVLDLY